MKVMKKFYFGVEKDSALGHCRYFGAILVVWPWSQLGYIPGPRGEMPTTAEQFYLTTGSLWML